MEGIEIKLNVGFKPSRLSEEISSFGNLIRLLTDLNGIAPSTCPLDSSGKILNSLNASSGPHDI